MAVQGKPRPKTRIQREKQDLILNAALDVFSLHGFRGATIDQIAEAAGMSKPNLLYYFASKEEIHRRLLANEMLQGAPHAIGVLEGELKVLVDDKARVIERWMDEGRITRTDPYHL